MVLGCDKEAAAGHRICPLSVSAGMRYRVAAPEIYSEGRCTPAHIDNKVTVTVLPKAGVNEEAPTDALGAGRARQ